MSDTNDLQGGLKYAQIIATAASISGSIWLLFSCCKAPRSSRLRDDLVVLVGAQAVADLIYAFPNVLSILNLPILCPLEGFTRQLYLISMCLVTSIAILSFLKKREQVGGGPDSQRSFVYLAILFSTLIAFIFASLPIFLSKYFTYGGTSNNCWITTPFDQEALRFAVLGIFEIIPFILGSMITIYFYRRAMKISDNTLGSFGTQRFRKQFLFPLFFFVFFLPSIIDDFTIVLGKKDIKEPRYPYIQMVHILLMHSIGLTHAIVYKVQNIGIFSRNSAGLSMQENA